MKSTLLEVTHEVTIDGPLTRRWVLEASDYPELRAHRIARLGLEDAVAPYRRVRIKPQGSFLLATVAGEGRIRLEGKWNRISAGSLFMAPPRVLNAIHAVPGKRWSFAWVRYEEPPFVRALVGADSPVRASAGGTELVRSIQGLRVEWEGLRAPNLLHHWVSLVQAMAQRAAAPLAVDNKLAALWAEVATSLDNGWTLESLASRIGVGPEALRRRSHLEMGRSPMHHVTYMRMQRAQELLETSDLKIEAVAAEVGFSDGPSFARCFKRNIGISPSGYREKH